MGSMVSVAIGKYDFVSYKNTFGDLLLFYSPLDRRVTEYIEDGEKFVKYEYVTIVKKAKICLDVLGYTVNLAKQNFESGKTAFIDFRNEMDDWSDFTKGDYEKDFSFENWSNAAKKFAVMLASDTFERINNSLGYVKLEEYRTTKNLTIAEKEVIRSLPFDRDSRYFGFPIDLDYDSCGWEAFRVLLDGFDENQEIILDYTALFDGGWCGEYPTDEDFCVEKTIVLTEGNYDAKVLSESMSILYPFMSKFYSFIDFQSFKIDGGVSYLAKYTKAFAAAGIKNKVISLFDNDTAGICEMTALETFRFPDNFKSVLLPYNDDANNWTTLGHTQIENIDINGLACSIELYLGRDVLVNDKGELFPIRWTGFNDRANKYQGEIQSKSCIHSRFDEKVKKAIETGIDDCSTWRQIDKILNAIFNAFIDLG